MSPLKKITLCADDFGLNPGVSEGILKLVRKRRLSAVSCMVNMPHFQNAASDLNCLKDQVKIGLHFNLTEGEFLSQPNKPCFSLNELLFKTHIHAINRSLIANEFRHQLEKFVQVMGVLPAFIDGHQHVHQFPIIRQIILEIYEQKLRPYQVSIRSTYPAISATPYGFKTKILALTGGKMLSSTLKKAAIPHNAHFSGIYDFASNTNYRALFRKWVSAITDDTLIMCHPGEPCSSPDSIAAARLVELNYFLSQEFITDCQEYGIQSLE